MSFRQFIYSDKFHLRIVKHVIFWITCVIFFQLSYWFPTYWYPAWNTKGISSPIIQGPISYFNKCLLVAMYSLLCMSFFMFFTYPLIYLLLPRFLMKSRYVLFAMGTLVLLFLTSIVVFYGFVFISPQIQHYFGWSGRDPRTNVQLIQCALDITLFNCPTIGGLALSIKLLKGWYLRQEKTAQLATTKANVELQLLKAQIHPHFLFNTLNNIYSFTLTSSPKAPEMVKKLSGLLQYIIHECNQPRVSLRKELEMIRDYMALEKIRYGEEMDMSIDIRGNSDTILIAPLLLIPFVENSFKHGASKMLSRPWVNLHIIIEGNMFYFLLNNSKPEEYSSPVRDRGIGLTNVQKRLTLLYPGNHVLKMTEEPQHFTVLLEINLSSVRQKDHGKKENKKIHDQKLA
jgi:Histidine kinase